MPPIVNKASPLVSPPKLNSNEVVASEQPSLTLELEGGDWNASTPELIKVTRKKKGTTSGKKKRPKDDGSTASSKP